jgi:hypothetical protein
MAREYYKEGEQFTEIKMWFVTNNYALKDMKRKFKFEDLPCLVVTEHIASNRKRREHFYRDEIEQTIRTLTTEEMRKHARSSRHRIVSPLRMRVREAEQKYTRDVIPAEDDDKTVKHDMPKVRKRKGSGSKKDATNT